MCVVKLKIVRWTNHPRVIARVCVVCVCVFFFMVDILPHRDGIYVSMRAV